MTKGRTTMYGVTITELIQKMNLKNGNKKQKIQ